MSPPFSPSARAPSAPRSGLFAHGVPPSLPRGSARRAARLQVSTWRVKKAFGKYCEEKGKKEKNSTLLLLAFSLSLFPFPFNRTWLRTPWRQTWSTSLLLRRGRAAATVTGHQRLHLLCSPRPKQPPLPPPPPRSSPLCSHPRPPPTGVPGGPAGSEPPSRRSRRSWKDFRRGGERRRGEGEKAAARTTTAAEALPPRLALPRLRLRRRLGWRTSSRAAGPSSTPLPSPSAPRPSSGGSPRPWGASRPRRPSSLSQRRCPLRG